jgi:hypothetical protein
VSVPLWVRLRVWLAIGSPKLLVTLQGVTASTLTPTDFHY